jgi:hypothetical protein
MTGVEVDHVARMKRAQGRCDQRSKGNDSERIM